MGADGSAYKLNLEHEVSKTNLGRQNFKNRIFWKTLADPWGLWFGV